MFFSVVSDIQCSFSSQGSTVADSITAVLKKPAGFKGSPLFADDRTVNPNNDRKCSIEPDHNDPNEQTYNLKILDFSKCGVLKRNVRCGNIVGKKMINVMPFSCTGFRSCARMVSTISGRCDAIGPRADHYV